jgi:hypothetical protein
MNGKASERDRGNATSAVLISLLHPLAENDLLTNSEIRALLKKAANDLGQHEYGEPMKGPAGIILDDLLPQFPENGGD